MLALARKIVAGEGDGDSIEPVLAHAQQVAAEAEAVLVDEGWVASDSVALRARRSTLDREIGPRLAPRWCHSSQPNERGWPKALVNVGAPKGVRTPVSTLKGVGFNSPGSVHLLQHRARRLVALGQTALQQLLSPGRQLQARRAGEWRELLKECAEVVVRSGAETFYSSIDEVRQCVLARLAACVPECTSPRRPEIDAQPQRPLDGHLLVAEGGVREELRLLALLEPEEGVANPRDVALGELAVLVAEVLAQRAVPLRGVDQLHPATPAPRTCGSPAPTRRWRCRCCRTCSAAARRSPRASRSR